jgi:hypothetical protein
MTHVAKHCEDLPGTTGHCILQESNLLYRRYPSQRAIVRNRMSQQYRGDSEEAAEEELAGIPTSFIFTFRAPDCH